MTHRRLMQSVDTREIEEAIRVAELRTSGEVRVSVSRLFWGDVEKAARKAFERMGMTQTQQRNAVLFFVVPSRRIVCRLGRHGNSPESRAGVLASHRSGHVRTIPGRRFHGRTGGGN